MKRLIIAIPIHCAFIFICLFFYVSQRLTVPELIPGMEFSYTLLSTTELFLAWLPAALFSVYVVTYASVFGKDGKRIMTKYSPYILSQFKNVAIFAIIGTTLVVCGQEVFNPLVKQRLQQMEEAPMLYREYMQAATKYNNSGDLVFAIQYAGAAERIYPHSQEATTLKSDLEVQLEGTDYDEALASAILAQENYGLSSHDRNATSFELFQKAQQAYLAENWIDAHYYSMVAQKVAEPGSANVDDAKIMAADAWNMLDEPSRFENDAVEEQYRLKKLAYSQLMMGSVVEAYYSFSDLIQRYPHDEDIARYYAAAAVEMEAQYFFLDEIPISYELEDRRDIAFRLHQQDGGEQILFIKGLSSVSNTGGLVQYARGLSIYEFSMSGRFEKSMYVPYAKIMGQPIASLDTATRQSLEYTDLNMEKGTVPVIMLESVDRVQPNSLNKPVYKFAEGQSQATGQIITLPIDYKDFLLLKNTSPNPEDMMLADVIQMSLKARDYGYAQVVYNQDACSRVSKPFLYIVFLIVAASIGWNYRIMSDRFRFSWVLTPLLLTVGIYCFLEIAKYTQRLLNYGLFGIFKFAAAPIIFVLALVFVFSASLLFVRRRSQN